MKCLIIASGKSRYLQKNGDCKLLMPLYGVPLIERTIMQAHHACVDEFYVVTGHQHGRVEFFLDILEKRIDVPITTIFNPDWDMTEDGVSVLCGKPYLQEPFLLLKADRTFDESIVSDLVREYIPENGITLAVDSFIDNPMIDPDDVLRLKTLRGKVRAIGENLTDFDSYDTGIAFSTPALFNTLEKSCSGVGGTSLSAGLQRLAAWGKVATFDIEPRFWINADNPIGFWRAENVLLKSGRR